MQYMGKFFFAKCSCRKINEKVTKNKMQESISAKQETKLLHLSQQKPLTEEQK
jgi:hypothetical protein